MNRDQNSDLAARVAAILASPAVSVTRAPSDAPWPFELPEPPDLAALYAACDGLELADGTNLLPRGEFARTTSWLKQERALDDWNDELIVLGERTDLVLVRDLDGAAKRAGGGVLEAATDSLSTFKRITLGVVGYLESRVSPGEERDPSPERIAQRASSRRDIEALREALSRPFYPGSERDFAHAALTLGALLAASGDEAAALSAFERSVEARALCVSPPVRASESAAAWKACAIAAEKAGASAVAQACAARATSLNRTGPAPRRR